MKIELNQNDFEKVSKIERISVMNSEVLELYADYLANRSCFITQELMEDIINSCHVSEEYAYLVLFAAACGLNMENSKRDLQITEVYLKPSIKKLEVKSYQENAYYKNVKIPEIQIGNWELKYEKYQPYEAFIYNDLVVDQDFREIPLLGFFSEEFLFPAVLESGTEWMTITPNEIETMQPVVDVVTGKVITFGLGLGYFAYMASEKEDVQSVTIVEMNKKVIRLFKKYILPQFPHKKKIEIIAMDAFEFAENHMSDMNYNYAFVDLWHDASDGVGLYLKMKKLECRCPDTKYYYWIEDTILSGFRFLVLPVLLDGIEADHKNDSSQGAEEVGESNDPKESGEEEFERRYRAISSYMSEIDISTFRDFIYYLSNAFLRKLAVEIMG
ncbi:MAG: hypothetical protein WBI07_05680 [Mobilitalea sp.]